MTLITETISFTSKLLKQGYRYHKHRKAFSKFYYRHLRVGCEIQNLVKDSSAARHIKICILR